MLQNCCRTSIWFFYRSFVRLFNMESRSKIDDETFAFPHYNDHTVMVVLIALANNTSEDIQNPHKSNFLKKVRELFEGHFEKSFMANL